MASQGVYICNVSFGDLLYVHMAGLFTVHMSGLFYYTCELDLTTPDLCLAIPLSSAR